MGGMGSEFVIPSLLAVRNDITFKGKWMYEREDVKHVVKMVEGGVLRLKGGIGVKGFGLEEWDEAFAAAEGGATDHVVFVP